MNFTDTNLKWIREPEKYSIENNKISIVTEPHTDLWQKTYYKFINDNAPVLQTETSDKYFSFTVKAYSKNHLLNMKIQSIST